MNKEQIDAIFEFLEKCNIEIPENRCLDGLIIYKDTLTSEQKYNELEPYILNLKKVGLSASSLTALQYKVASKQRWPLVCAVRQFLKTYGYKMVPKRSSNGYDSQTGKKQYIRYYVVEKFEENEVCEN